MFPSPLSRVGARSIDAEFRCEVGSSAQGREAEGTTVCHAREREHPGGHDVRSRNRRLEMSMPHAVAPSAQPIGPKAQIEQMDREPRSLSIELPTFGRDHANFV